MLTLFCQDGPVRDYDDARPLRHGALRRRSSGTCSSRGVYLAPSQFECMFVSLAHGDEEIDRTIEAVGDFFGS